MTDNFPKKFIPLICYKTNKVVKMDGKEKPISFVLQMLMVEDNEKIKYYLYYVLLSSGEKPFMGYFIDEDLSKIKECCERFIIQFREKDFKTLKFNGEEMNNKQYKEKLDKWLTT